VIDAPGNLVEHRHQWGSDAARPRRNEGSRNAVDDDDVGVSGGASQYGTCRDDPEGEYQFTTGLEAKQGVVLAGGRGHATVVQVSAGQALRVTEREQ
jgi:hypothetical protein